MKAIGEFSLTPLTASSFSVVSSCGADQLNVEHDSQSSDAVRKQK
jgi:hypothetical protein